MQEVRPSRHAIVYGASGLIGWALVNELLKAYPKPDAFDKVTAVTNREIELSKTYWPETGRPELQLCSGIDLRGGDGATLADALRQKIRDVENVTHIFYLGGTPTSLENGHTDVRPKCSQASGTKSKKWRSTGGCSRTSLTATN